MAVLPIAALVLCFFIPAGESQQFTITVENSQINAPVGSNALFSVRPSSKVSSGGWSINGTSVVRWIDQTVSVGNEYTSRAELFTSNGSLLLKSVKISDSGEYRVNMAPVNGLQSSATITLKVFVAPEPTPDGSGGSSGLSAGAIAGIVIAVIVVVALVTALILYIIKKKAIRLNAGYDKSDPKTTSPENIQSSQTEYAEIERKTPSQPKPTPSSNGTNAAPAQAKDGYVIYTRPNIINAGAKPTSEPVIDNRTDYAEVKYR